MKDKIHDQLLEGSFYNALAEAIPEIVLKTGFFEGPIYRKVKSKRLQPDPATGKMRLVVEDRIIAEYERVSPLDIYPAPDSNGIDDGYLIKKTAYNGTQLSSLIGVPGFSDTAVRAVLQEYGKGGLKEWTGIETDRAQAENKDSSVAWDSTKIDCLVFYGDIQGRDLREWGMTEQEIGDPDIFYSAQAWLIGNHVIKAMLNPDPLGRKNLYKASFDESDGGFLGNRPSGIDPRRAGRLQRLRPPHREQRRHGRRAHGGDQRRTLPGRGRSHPFQGLEGYRITRSGATPRPSASTFFPWSRTSSC